MDNPLLREWTAPFNTPPFNEFKVEQFKPAIENCIESARQEIKEITDNPSPPDFENCIGALDRTGEKLDSITSVLFNLNSADTNKDLQAATQEISPLLTRFANDITLNRKLFRRIEKVYNNRDNISINQEQKMLLEKIYRSFLLGGASLSEEKRKRFRKISEELSQLCLKFEENVLEETNSFELHLTRQGDLAGLPEALIETAAMEADKRKKKGWIFTLHYPSYIPFMQYSEKRDLREKMLKAFSSRAFRGNEFDNRDLVTRISNLRLELANLLGFNNYAVMVLEDRMAEKQEKVEAFLDELYKYSHPAALRDMEELKIFAGKLGQSEPIERWDWAYYSEKLKKSKYNIDDEVLRPYFRLETVQEAIFELAGRLYQINFSERSDIPLYHPEVKTWEVSDHESKHLALLYLDYHPRPGKNGGAWMTSFREQRKAGSDDVRPLVSIVTNFSRATGKKPSLLSFTELTTFLHEFGHALHAILSKCNYKGVSGTSVTRDFVELPSQFMENWAYEQEWLDTWAVHYKSGEKIPFEIIQKIKEASTFNEGYACDRQLGFGFLDMAWHTITAPVETDVAHFESTILSKTDLFPPVESANMSCVFTHLFGGGYAAGYYGYKWAEVLDADAFSYFRERGIFNNAVATAFRKNILEKGGSGKPLDLYIAFRGREPSADALLERSGLK